MSRKSVGWAFFGAMALGLLSLPAQAADDAQLARGKYLVGIAGCNDCHTPGYFFGKPDMTKFLAGSEVGFEIPELGVFHGPNLTPDKETGLGNWSIEQIMTAFQTTVFMCVSARRNHGLQYDLAEFIADLL